jgi:hypothetical protein
LAAIAVAAAVSATFAVVVGAVVGEAAGAAACAIKLATSGAVAPRVNAGAAASGPVTDVSAFAAGTLRRCAASNIDWTIIVARSDPAPIAAAPFCAVAVGVVVKVDFDAGLAGLVGLAGAIFRFEPVTGLSGVALSVGTIAFAVGAAAVMPSGAFVFPAPAGATGVVAPLVAGLSCCWSASAKFCG